MHGPVGPARLAELACPVQRVDDPQATLTGHVLEPLLGPDVVTGVEAPELPHQELVRHAVARRADVTQRGGVGSQLHQGTARHLGQEGRVTVLVGQVFAHDPLV